MRAVTGTFVMREVMEEERERVALRERIALAVYAPLLVSGYWGHTNYRKTAEEAVKAADALVWELRRTTGDTP